MFGIDAVEFVVLIVVAVVVFGPERLPQFSRKAARVLVYLRDIANNAQTQLRTELGPEYSNLELKDLNPKTFIRKQLADEIKVIEEARKDLLEAKKSLDDATKAAKADSKEAEAAITKQAATAAVTASGVAALDAPLRFDSEAT
ncbi:MAG: sec-independent translocase [Arachnia sp.]